MKPILLCILIIMILAGGIYFGYEFCMDYAKDYHPATQFFPFMNQ